MDMAENWAGDCPCGGEFVVPAATYSNDPLDDDVIHATASTPEGFAQLRQVARLAQKMLDSGATPEQVRAEVARHTPQVAERMPKGKAPLGAFVAALAACGHAYYHPGR